MLEIEVDVFSGMPNPTIQLSDREEQQLVDRVLAAPEQVSGVFDTTDDLGLGYRGIIIHQVKPDSGPWARARTSGDQPVAGAAARPGSLPMECRVGARGPATDSAEALLLEILDTKDVALRDEARELVNEGVQALPAARDTEQPPEGDFETEEQSEPEIAPLGATWWACNSPYYSANASYFNQPAYVSQNNCYCFGSNHLANVRYALPGRRGGRPATAITCGGVIDGLRADGWIDSCQSNTLTIAMVIWPGQDYHFYRVVTAGSDWWWGHKPGGTPARYTDNSGRALKQPFSPANCDRGPYTYFCGYFYQNNLTAYVA